MSDRHRRQLVVSTAESPSLCFVFEEYSYETQPTVSRLLGKPRSRELLHIRVPHLDPLVNV